MAPTEYQNLNYDVRDGKAYVTLNRPEKLNALSQALQEEISQAMWEADNDTRVHCVILGGAGRAFCAGYDLTPAPADLVICWYGRGATLPGWKRVDPDNSRYGDPTGGAADGIMFVVQTVGNNVGGSGGNIGYFGITNSVGIEYDTYEWKSPDGKKKKSRSK